MCPSKVFLLPSVLARKRRWNPKYPICIQLAGGVDSQEEVGRRSEESRKVEEQPKTAPASSFQRFPESTRNPAITLYLFGRTGREKEEWFHHFLLASTDAEREKDRDKPRSSRCVPRSGRRIIDDELVTTRPLDKASM